MLHIGRWWIAQGIAHRRGSPLAQLSNYIPWQTLSLFNHQRWTQNLSFPPTEQSPLQTFLYYYLSL